MSIVTAGLLRSPVTCNSVIHTSANHNFKTLFRYSSFYKDHPCVSVLKRHQGWIRGKARPGAKEEAELKEGFDAWSKMFFLHTCLPFLSQNYITVNCATIRETQINNVSGLSKVLI